MISAVRVTTPYICHLSKKNNYVQSERFMGCKSRVHLKVRIKWKRDLHAAAADGFVFYCMVRCVVRYTQVNSSQLIRQLCEIT